ncbi:MAG: hypothetical protein F6K14_26345 [Symploca sp. SIO2C1]|nr:hypothetical protein [Symploca sp. SIO2C1]
MNIPTPKKFAKTLNSFDRMQTAVENLELKIDCVEQAESLFSALYWQDVSSTGEKFMLMLPRY